MSFFGLASLLLMIVDLTLAEYDPSTPHRVENFDPAEADPAGRLTCLGPLPPWPLPVPLEGDWDPNSFTLQELCAKPQYGGRGPDQHLGGYCPRYPFRAYPPNYSRGLEKAIAFDDSPGAQTARSLANPRTLIYCRSRCFCSYGLDDTTIQPRFVPHLDAEYLQYPASKTYQIMIDEVDDFRVAPQSHRGKDDWGILSTWLWMVEEINQDDHLGRMEPVSISRENTIRCSGPKPTWPLPEPYTAAHFHSLTALCAVQLSNGFPSANAGGYCHRDTFQETQDVWFSDEMTPRIDWTWDNLAASAAIRFHCWRHCECSVDGQPNNRTVAPLWHFLASADLVLKPDGAVDVNFRPVTNPSASSTMPVLPASSGTKPAAGTCGADGLRFCKQPWPTSLLGPVPTAPPKAEIKLGPSNNRCGKRCTRQRDCRGAGTGEPCRCVAVDHAQARAAGLDPVFPGAACLLITQSFLEQFRGVNQK